MAEMMTHTQKIVQAEAVLQGLLDNVRHVEDHEQQALALLVNIALAEARRRDAENKEVPT